MTDAIAEPTWLGTSDKYARLRKIETLSLETDYREITGLFYSDFRSVMAGQSLRGFMLTFAAPRMSRILAATGEIEHRMGKRFIDTVLLAQAVMVHGLGPGPGRDAARRVNAMHKNYDIHEEDFVMVGADEALMSLELAENFGWRPVTDKEREAVRIFYDHQARAYGSRRSLPPTVAETRAFWEDYMDRELGFEPQNRRLAESLLVFFEERAPRLLRPLVRKLLLGSLDPRLLRACGLPVPGKLWTKLARVYSRRQGRRDPVADNPPDTLGPMIAAVYPDGWTIDTVGTHLKVQAVAPATT